VGRSIGTSLRDRDLPLVGQTRSAPAGQSISPCAGFNPLDAQPFRFREPDRAVLADTDLTMAYYSAHGAACEAGC
jgi:hypothetical protein